MKEKCINFDWLQVWTYEPYWLTCADSYRDMGWVVKERSWGTRIFREVLTLIDRMGKPFVEICRNPKSKKSEGGIIQDNAVSIRLVNHACYSPTAINDLAQFLQDSGFEYKDGKLAGIQRIDIALDFAKFDVLEDSPQLFVNDYMSGKYSKVTQPNVRACGVDGYAWKRYNSLSWGSPSSMVSTKMYCKTQEMAEVKEKPWIRQAWVDAGILTNSLDETPVWRIEFKITGECHQWIDEDGLIINNTLQSFASETNLMSCVKGLLDHYFDFRIVDCRVPKYKAQKVDLWRFPKGTIRALPRRKEHFRDTGRAELILMNKLDRMREQASTTTDLSSIMQVKQMVLSLYRTKKELATITDGLTEAQKQNVLSNAKIVRCTQTDYQRTQEILIAANNLAQTAEESNAVYDTYTMVRQMWQTISDAMDRETLWKSLFPSSRTGVQLSDFLDEYSAKGWFVTECNRLKQRYMELQSMCDTPLSLLSIYYDLLPKGMSEEIAKTHFVELYYKNELQGHAE